MFFAARETARAWAEKREMKRREQGRQEGLREGRQVERERIQRELAQRGMPLTPEQVRIISGETVKDESE